MDKEQVTKILEKIKKTVGENNYKLALAITGHRPGKIRDITMASKDGELLLEYVEQLEQKVKKQQEVIDKLSKIIYEINDLKETTGGYPSHYIDNLVSILKEVSK